MMLAQVLLQFKVAIKGVRASHGAEGDFIDEAGIHLFLAGSPILFVFNNQIYFIFPVKKCSKALAGGGLGKDS